MSLPPNTVIHYITRITVEIEATKALAWPHFAGSALRGAFGRALRQAACITKQSRCNGCPLRNTCAYGVVFDPAPMTEPLHPSFRDGLPRYLVQAPELSARSLRTFDVQSFTLVLLPGAQPHQALIEHSLKQAVEQQLFEPGRFKLRQTNIDTVDASEIAPDESRARPSEQAEPTPKSTHQIRLRWLTPLRLQVHGKPIFKPQALDAVTLARALHRRHIQWCQLTNQSLPDNQIALVAAKVCALDTSRLPWHDIQRHSGTQDRTLPLGGLIGTATLHGSAIALHSLLPLLQLGEMIHIGKETVMGLGRYQFGPIETV